MNTLSTRIRPLAVAITLLSVASLNAAEMDKEYLKTLPAEEQALGDTVDHWGLPFADQLQRFARAQAAFSDKLGSRAPAGFIVGTQHGLEKVPRTKYWFKGQYGTSLSITAARNEYESFQVAVLADVGRKLDRVTLAAGVLSHQDGRNVIAVENMTIYRVGYIKTLAARYPSPYTGHWPDYLLPNGPIKVSGAELGLFWVDVKVPRDAPAGDYKGQLVVTADGQSVTLDLALHVYNFELPDRVPLPIAVWTSPKLPSGEKMPPEAYRALMAEFLRHGVDPISVGKSSVSLAKNDFSALDENLEFCFARGLQLFEIPNPGNKPERLKPLVEHLRKKGWIDKALVYSNQDEPDTKMFNSKNVPYYQSLRKMYPDLRVYLASEYHAGIDRGCDIWMTDLSTGGGAAFSQANHGRADLWFYYCHLPIRIDFHRPLVQAPNMQIDNEAIEHRLALWLAWKHQTTGMFIWAGNRGWTKKDLDRKDWQTRGWPLPPEPYGFPYGGVHNGNGYLIYPGPSPSIRLKVLRDGSEDFGYLAELKRRVAKCSAPAACKQAERLLSVPGSVLVDAHYFNRDPAALLKVRAEIGRLIETLGR